MAESENRPIKWPEGKKFAFTIFDDTDRATLENNKAIYGLLSSLGIKTTKSVWAFDGKEPPYIPGVTCSDESYVDWLKELAEDGFEIGWHLATWETAKRETTIMGLDRFRKLFGHDPRSMANHASNEEGIYWGSARISGILGWLSRLKEKFGTRFRGHVEGDPLFWGDFCKERIQYVRNFVFNEINTLAACPEMPYHDPARPFVNRWYASSEGADADSFVATLSKEAVDSLEQEGGACIMYTHFGKGFYEEGKLDKRFVKVMEYISSKRGWFVPVSELLDYLEEQRNSEPNISSGSRRKLERKWFKQKISSRLFKK